MQTSQPRKIFVNLAVENLERAMSFFRALGFEFDPRFTDQNAACMIVNEHAYAMLLTHDTFRRFTTRPIVQTSNGNEALLALSCNSRDEVNQMVEKAIAAGGSHAMDPQDHGFMYGWSFYDPDGHHWEVLWMDMSKVSGAV
jgi:predicted lactoylglutathione lyase